VAANRAKKSVRKRVLLLEGDILTKYKGRKKEMRGGVLNATPPHRGVKGSKSNKEIPMPKRKRRGKKNIKNYNRGS